MLFACLKPPAGLLWGLRFYRRVHKKKFVFGPFQPPKTPPKRVERPFYFLIVFPQLKIHGTKKKEKKFFLQLGFFSNSQRFFTVWNFGKNFPVLLSKNFFEKSVPFFNFFVNLYSTGGGFFQVLLTCFREFFFNFFPKCSNWFFFFFPPAHSFSNCFLLFDFFPDMKTKKKFFLFGEKPGEQFFFYLFQ